MESSDLFGRRRSFPNGRCAYSFNFTVSGLRGYIVRASGERFATDGTARQENLGRQAPECGRRRVEI
jgi:hypothetical protein